MGVDWILQIRLEIAALGAQINQLIREVQELKSIVGAGKQENTESKNE